MAILPLIIFLEETGIHADYPSDTWMKSNDGRPELPLSRACPSVVSHYLEPDLKFNAQVHC